MAQKQTLQCLMNKTMHQEKVNIDVKNDVLRLL